MKKPTRMFCQICGKVHKIDFWVPNEIWEEAIHPRWRETHVCINCFTERADEKLLYWDVEIRYYSTSMASQIDIQNMNEPIQYREYVITFDKGRYFFQHCEFTGAEDKRYGDSGSLLGAEEQIDNLTIEEQEHTITILRKKVADLELDLEVLRDVSKENFELKA